MRQRINLHKVSNSIWIVFVILGLISGSVVLVYYGKDWLGDYFRSLIPTGWGVLVIIYGGKILFLFSILALLTARDIRRLEMSSYALIKAKIKPEDFKQISITVKWHLLYEQMKEISENSQYTDKQLRIMRRRFLVYSYWRKYVLFFC